MRLHGRSQSVNVSVLREKVIVEDIHQHARNPPVRRPQSLHAPHHRRMLIRIAINLPVQPYAQPQFRR